MTNPKRHEATTARGRITAHRWRAFRGRSDFFPPSNTEAIDRSDNPLRTRVRVRRADSKRMNRVEICSKNRKPSDHNGFY
ncbi:MAG: hypothetical protein M3R15_04020, partial [Acidobacteriota bacterium]|nr:hypothetical protein [Acidobacteriota bacterium]